MNHALNLEMKDSKGVLLYLKPWLTRPEAMKLMRLGRLAVQDHIDKGHWLAVMQGKRPRIATDSIRQWLDAEAAKPRPALPLAA